MKDFESGFNNALELLSMKDERFWTTPERAFASAAEWYPSAGMLEDPVKRLEVITWLRGNGWKVEPA